MSEVVVSVQGLNKQYGENGTIALSNVSIDIQKGKFISILGPSGCGKSTLLRCIAGLEQPTSGKLIINGKESTETPDGIGMVFQRDALLAWRTIEDNLKLPLELTKRKTSNYTEKIKSLLRLTGLENFADKYPHQLSGGMRQRASICRALVDDPSILLMDEPFSALDAFTRDQMNEELQRIWTETNNTILFVTHGIAEAVFLADVVLVMSPRPGRIMEVIEIDLPRPRNLNLRESERFGRYTSHIRNLFDQMLIER